MRAVQTWGTVVLDRIVDVEGERPGGTFFCLDCGEGAGFAVLAQAVTYELRHRCPVRPGITTADAPALSPGRDVNPRPGRCPHGYGVEIWDLACPHCPHDPLRHSPGCDDPWGCDCAAFAGMVSS